MTDFIKGVLFGCICIFLIAVLFQYFWSGDTCTEFENTSYESIRQELTSNNYHDVSCTRNDTMITCIAYDTGRIL